MGQWTRNIVGNLSRFLFPDLWMDYVKFEMKRGDPKNVSNIYQRAVRELAPIQADIFISEFALQKSRVTSHQDNSS